jgi:hypothetical protein
MTHEPCTTCNIRLKDGRCVSFDELLAMGQIGIVELASASLLDDTPHEVLADLMAIPQTIGDDTQDVLVGAYNLAQNAHLLRYPAPSVLTDAPAIVVGSGPSLADWIPKLRETYGSYLIVASASAVRPLVDAGITPHLVAPKERTRYPKWCFDGCPSEAIYAGLHVVPDITALFPQRLCVGDATPLSMWFGSYLHVAPGPTSGTHALSIALMTTSGPIALIGMDNCGGHYAGYQGVEQRNSETVMCHDGVQRESKWLYRIARANMSRKHENRVIQLSPTAAVTDGIPLGALPSPKPFTLPKILPSPSEKYDDFMAVLRTLPKDFDTVWGMTQSATTLDDTDMGRLVSGNYLLFQSMFAPTVAQLSMERRLGMSDADVMQWYREATRNILDMSADTMYQMATCGGYYER